MNKKDTEKLLNFLNKNLDKYNDVYVLQEIGKDLSIPRSGFYFYGEHGSVFQISSDCEKILIEIKSSKNDDKDKYNITIEVDFDTLKDFLNRMFQILFKKELEQRLLMFGFDIENAKEKINIVKRVMKSDSENLATLIENSKILTFKDNEQKHLIRFEKLYEFKNKISTLGMVKLPIVIDLDSKDKEGNWNQAYIELLIPGWELKNYPALYNFIGMNDNNDSIESLLKKLDKYNPALAKSLQIEDLNVSIEKSEQVKKVKI